MKNHVYLQARVFSERLPSKVLKKICGKTIIELIVERVQKIEKIDKIILVTGSEQQNKQLIEKFQKLNLDYFCGNEINVLDRFYNASNHFNSDNIIRITCDNPLVDYRIINQGLKIFLKKDVDILSNDRIPTFPYGLNFEIFKKSILHQSWKEMKENFSNEKDFFSKPLSPVLHMLQSNEFKNYDFLNDDDLSHIRLTIDYPDDFKLVSKIFEHFYKTNTDFGLDEIISFFNKQPDLALINKNHVKLDYGLFPNKSSIN